MDERMKKVKREIISLNKVNKGGSTIFWNREQSKERHGDDYCIDFHFFIKYRNPDNILDRIEEIFNQRSFSSPLNKVVKLRGHVEGTVNDYLLVTYTTSRTPEDISFKWTDIPSYLDKNLSNNYKKYGKMEDYISKFIKD